MIRSTENQDLKSETNVQVSETITNKMSLHTYMINLDFVIHKLSTDWESSGLNLCTERTF